MRSHSDDDTLMQLKHSTPSKIRFADEAGPSTAPSKPATPSTPNTDTTTVTSIGITDCHLLLDSGSGCTIINMSLAKEIMFNCMQAQWSAKKKTLELKPFSKDIVETLGTLKTPVLCYDWKIQKANITVVADGFQPILGRALFDQLGVTISQNPCPNIEVNTVETPCVIKQSLAKEFPELISRIRKSKHHSVNSKIHRIYLCHASKREKSADPSPKDRTQKITKRKKISNCFDQFLYLQSLQGRTKRWKHFSN